MFVEPADMSQVPPRPNILDLIAAYTTIGLHVDGIARQMALIQSMVGPFGPASPSPIPAAFVADEPTPVVAEPAPVVAEPAPAIIDEPAPVVAEEQLPLPAVVAQDRPAPESKFRRTMRWVAVAVGYICQLVGSILTIIASAARCGN